MVFLRHIRQKADHSDGVEEKSSRLMDVMLDELNFNRNLVHKSMFRMTNKPSDRMLVEFRNLEDNKDVFFLDCGKRDSYNAVVCRVAQKLLVDRLQIRLTRHNCFLNIPDSDHPIEFLFDGCLLDMVFITDKICNILYYEVLDDPQVDLAHFIKLNVSYGYPYKETSVVLSRLSTVEDLLNDIKLKMKLTISNAELRLLGIYNCKIYKFFHVEEKIEDIPKEANLWVEKVLEEKNLGRGRHLISVYHFTKIDNGVTINFGEPFLFVIDDKETLAVVKVRIQEKLRIENDEFSKWKFTLLCMGRLQYLEDRDVVYSCFEENDDVLEKYLGMEHCMEYEDDGFNFTVVDDASDVEVSGSDSDSWWE